MDKLKVILPKGYTIAEKYTVMLFIKLGNNAETYRVKGVDGKLYFLKLFYSKLPLSSFDNDKNLFEIEFVKNIKHVNIVSYKDNGELIFEGKKYIFLVLEFIAGETLSEQISREPISSIYDVKQIALGILNGLSYLHGLPEPIIHNAITPQNIMMDLSGKVSVAKIIGFSYARSFLQSTKSYYNEGLDLNYVASECFNNLYSPQSDLFSVGAIMFQLLFGMPPWFRDISKYQATRMKMEERIIEDRKKQLTFPNIESTIVDFDESILPILKKALNNNPENRFQSASEFIDAINGKISVEEVEETTAMVEKKVVEKGKGFSAIAGMQELKDKLQSEVIEMIENPEIFDEHGLGLPNGILFYGPPGCGKTFFAERFAEEAGYNFIKVISSDIASIYVHGSQEKIAKLFKEARENAPTILYFDELDAMVPSRIRLNNQSQSGEVNEFLSQLDNIGDFGVLVIGSTNKPDLIDSAILRAGRLEKWYFVPPPDFEARKAMFELYLKKRPLDFGIDYDRLALLTENYVSSDIKFLIDESSRKTIKDKSKRITMVTLEYIIQHQKPTVSLSVLKEYEKIREKFENEIDTEIKTERRRVGFER